MNLKSLELQGFKSFPDKTRLDFKDGITAVVGPNGSGKSNISDALSWVLGEQSNKTLRGKSQDMVFNGTEKRKAKNFAEVSITFDNSNRSIMVDSDDVTVTRRYYRSGDSEYRINNASVRLKDLYEIFMDTGLGKDGYSIIGQGKIADIVSSKSEDRREVFEEAAGISKYRYRKTRAEKQLSDAEDNLIRLRDIMSELESRVGPLKEQSDKAEAFLKLSEQKKKYEIGIWIYNLEKMKNTLREQENKVDITKSEYDEIEKTLAEIEEKSEKIRTEIQQCAVKIDDIRREISNSEEKAIETKSQIDITKNNIFHNSENIKRITEEINAASANEKQMEDEISANNEKVTEKEVYIKSLEDQLGKVDSEIGEMQSKTNNFSGEIEAITTKINELSIQASNEKVRTVTSEMSIKDNEKRKEVLVEALNGNKGKLEELNSELTSCKQDYEQQDEKCMELSNSMKGYEIRLATRKDAITKIQSEINNLTLEANDKKRKAKMLSDMENNMEGYQASVKAVVTSVKTGILSGIYGTVSHLINVDSRYAKAIETAMGASVQNIVVENENSAKAAINFLKQRNIGRATFLPLTSIKGNKMDVREIDDSYGFVDLAVNLVGFENKFTNIFNLLLGRIVIAEDLDSAVAMAKKFGYKFRIVTLDGQVVNAGGSLTGGATVKGFGILSRAGDIKIAREQAAVYESKIEETKERLTLAESSFGEAEAEFTGAKAELATASEDKVRLMGEIKRLSEQIDYYGANLETVKAEEASLIKKHEELVKELDTSKESFAKIGEQISCLQTQFTSISGNRDSLKEKREELNRKSEQLRIDIITSQKDIESLKASNYMILERKNQSLEKTNQSKDEINHIKENSVQLEASIAELESSIKEFKEHADLLRNSIEDVVRGREEKDRSYTQLRNEEKDISARKDTVYRELARLEEKKESVKASYEDIISKLWDEYEMTVSEAEQISAPIDDIASAQRVLAEIKGKIKKIGTVNVDAIEEYKEVNQRYTFMKAQIDDVEKSKKELHKLIGELTEEMQVAFNESFRIINKNFGDIFAEMFGGGTASLTLSDPSDVLNSGIEINVNPPGKIITNMESLSGGEKSLISISLYFAIFKVNPAPFCVLDEIEAALDDVNVDRFANYLRRVTDRTQFIVITHRRGTMEEADVLYGVTMQEKGVSKLLELQVNEVEEKLKIKA